MEPADMLGTMSQIAITIAGFAGVVVAFGRSAIHEWSTVDKFRLRLLLTASTSALAFCLVGLLLLASSLSQTFAWSTCSLIVTVSFACNTIASLRAYARFTPEELEAAGARPRFFYMVSSVGAALVLLQVYNVVMLRAFWPYFAAIVLAILISVLQFTRMILAPRLQ